MGRRKIEIQPITHERNRSVTFLKRKNGLFKKAYELGVLCSVGVAVIIFEDKPNHESKLYEYSSGDIREIVQRHIRHQGEREHKVPGDFNGRTWPNDSYASRGTWVAEEGDYADDVDDMDTGEADDGDDDYEDDEDDDGPGRKGGKRKSAPSKGRSGGRRSTRLNVDPSYTSSSRNGGGAPPSHGHHPHAASAPYPPSQSLSQSHHHPHGGFPSSTGPSARSLMDAPPPPGSSDLVDSMGFGMSLNMSGIANLGAPGGGAPGMGPGPPPPLGIPMPVSNDRMSSSYSSYTQQQGQGGGRSNKRQRTISEHQNGLHGGINMGGMDVTMGSTGGSGGPELYMPNQSSRFRTTNMRQNQQQQAMGAPYHHNPHHQSYGQHQQQQQGHHHHQYQQPQQQQQYTTMFQGGGGAGGVASPPAPSFVPVSQGGGAVTKSRSYEPQYDPALYAAPNPNAAAGRDGKGTPPTKEGPQENIEMFSRLLEADSSQRRGGAAPGQPTLEWPRVGGGGAKDSPSGPDAIQQSTSTSTTSGSSASSGATSSGGGAGANQNPNPNPNPPTSASGGWYDFLSAVGASGATAVPPPIGNPTEKDKKKSADTKEEKTISSDDKEREKHEKGTQDGAKVSKGKDHVQGKDGEGAVGRKSPVAIGSKAGKKKLVEEAKGSESRDADADADGVADERDIGKDV